MPLLKRTVLYITLMLASLLLARQLWFLAGVIELRHHNPSQTALMAARIAEKPSVNINPHLWLPYAEISPALVSATVGAEDRLFMQHHGINWAGIKIAMQRNAARGTVVSGGSTITQQLAKNIFLSEEKSYTRKAQEAVIALMMEAILSKRRILEIYLNVIEWGDGVFGAEAAAQYYFGVSARHLNKQQAALLAAIIAAPRYYDKHRNFPRLAFKTMVIERRIGRMQIPAPHE